MISCNDDIPEYKASEVIDFYTGTHDCNPGEIVDVEITVTASGDHITLTWNEGTTWTTTLNGCTTETVMETIFFITTIEVKFDANFTDTLLNVSIETTESGITETCTFQLTKQ